MRENSMFAAIIYYSTEDVVHLKQYFIYGLSEFVSAAGGAMGMFLGWSFYQGAGDVFRWTKRVLGFLEKRRDMLMDK